MEFGDYYNNSGFTLKRSPRESGTSDPDDLLFSYLLDHLSLTSVQWTDCPAQNDCGIEDG